MEDARKGANCGLVSFRKSFDHVEKVWGYGTSDCIVGTAALATFALSPVDGI